MKSPWPEVKLGEFIKQRKSFILLEDDKEYHRATVRLHAKGIEPRDIILGSSVKTKKQYPIRANDLLVAEIDAKVGGYGIVSRDLEGAVVSSHYYLYEVDQSKIDIGFFSYWLQTPSPLNQIQQFIRGALNYAAIRPYHFPELEIRLPSMPEQQEIAEKIDQVTARVRETRRLVAEIETEQEYFLQSAYKDALKNSIKMPLSKCLYPYCQTVNIQDDIKYMQLTVSMHFRGISLRQILLGAKIKTKLQYRADEGDFIYSRIDARNGAFGFVPKELDGAIVTGDFPCFKVDENIINRDVLAIIIRKPEFTQSVIDASRGVTNRKRLKEEQLLSIIVDVPEKSYQKILSFLSHRVKKAQELHRQIALDLEYMMPALLNQAFRGEL